MLFDVTHGVSPGLQVARIRKDLDEQWEESSEDVRHTYGKAYLDEQFQAAISSSSTSFPTLHPIMAAFKDALLNEQPQNRYLTDGSNGLYDPYCVSKSARTFQGGCFCNNTYLCQNSCILAVNCFSFTNTFSVNKLDTGSEITFHTSQ